ncbi:zinc finger protein 7-like [Diospyros lotus]|uniref:zinc finger protein 7-like n=1 Tax=Diospyros lotus TaxID=55363 RepID=UPI002256267D|nr:zinc finger protein 7-like [Diospyros lotus]
MSSVAMHRKVDSSESSTNNQTPHPKPKAQVPDDELAHDSPKFWDYVCAYCRKPFPSSQSLGGHQNAHRKERKEDKKLFTKNPREYRRRRAWLKQNAQMPLTDNFPVAPPPAAAAAQAAVGPSTELALFPTFGNKQGGGSSRVVEPAAKVRNGTKAPKGRKSLEKGGAANASDGGLDLTLKL